MQGVGVVLFLALLGVTAGLGESQDPNVALAPPSVAHRKLFQGLGQGQVPDDVPIPDATCDSPTPFSFMVSLRDDSGNHICGGALINEGGNESQWVVTTAHCIDERSNPGALRMPDVDIAGRTRDKGIERIPAEKTIPHPKWKNDPRRGNDIALIKLQWKSCYRFPLNVAEKGFTTPENATVTFVSFGREAEAAGFADRQQVGMFDVIPTKKCKADFIQPGTKLDKTMMCSRGSDNVGVCAGDEGSPIVWSPPRGSPGGLDPFAKRLVGLASFTDAACSSADGTAIFTNVARYSKWIAKEMKKNSS